MKSLKILSVLMLLSLPLQVAVAQGKAPTNPKLTPEQREAAQARLNRQASEISKHPLDPNKAKLRAAIKMETDSVDAASGTAALILRAQATKSAAVEQSQARRLRNDCAVAQRTSAVTLLSIASLNTPDVKGTKLLNDYRAALNEVAHQMGECTKSLTTADPKVHPSSAKISAALSQVASANAAHVKTRDLLLGAMEISLR